MNFVAYKRDLNSIRGTEIMRVFDFEYSCTGKKWRITVELKYDCKKRSYVKIKRCVGCSNTIWKVTDEQLVHHMGLPMYQAFYDVICYNKEPIDPCDFDYDLLGKVYADDTIEVAEIREHIRRYKTNDYLQLWREVKATLASAIVIISNFEWVDYQKESCKLTAHSKNMIEYLIYSLTFITKRGCGNSMFAQDILNYLQRHHTGCLYPNNVSINICMGVESIERIVRESQECTIETLFHDDFSWWHYFWATVLLCVIVLLLIWVLFKWVEYTGNQLVGQYYKPVTWREVPASSI
jgi:hypothetical protein